MDEIYPQHFESLRKVGLVTDRVPPQVIVNTSNDRDNGSSYQLPTGGPSEGGSRGLSSRGKGIEVRGDTLVDKGITVRDKWTHGGGSPTLQRLSSVVHTKSDLGSRVGPRPSSLPLLPRSAPYDSQERNTF